MAMSSSKQTDLFKTSSTTTLTPRDISRRSIPIPRSRQSASVRIGVSLLHHPSSHPHPYPATHSSTVHIENTNEMPLHVIYVRGAPYMTPSLTLAADFGAWGYRVDTYRSSHHNVLALLSIQEAEGYDQREREGKLMDTWCAESLRRWGFSSPGRIGAVLSERLEEREVDGEEGRWHCGAAVGMGRESFSEGTRGVKVERAARERRGGWVAWLGRGRARRLPCEMYGEVLPVYTKGEDPPAYGL